MMRFSVEVKGADRLQRKLDEVRKMRHIATLLHTAADFIEHEAEQGTKPHSSDLGKLARGDFIRQEVKPLSARVFTNSPIVVEIDQGRQPGRMPPVRALARWAERHGIDRRRGFFIARAIGRRGSKPVHFFKRAAEAGEKRIRQLVGDAARAIESDWRR